jgi:hypothetical protein
MLLALAFAAPAHAERIGAAADDAVLAVAPDGTPFVAFVRDNEVVLERRGASGWSGQSVYSGPARLAGLAIGPGDAHNVLLEDPNGHWLTLATPTAVTPIVRSTARVGLLGPAGLALDAKGAPVVAYTAMRGRSQPKFGGIPTYLRLARGQGKQLRTSAITHRGFPQSYVPPAAAPVLVNGRIHVVETYTSAAIEWQPKAHGGWIGQYLFASLFGSPIGPVSAVAARGGSVWSAWTQEYPEFGETHVLVNLRAEDETTDDVVQHGALVSLTLSDDRPELAANDWVDVGGFRDYAGLLKDATGHTSRPRTVTARSCSPTRTDSSGTTYHYSRPCTSRWRRLRTGASPAASTAPSAAMWSSIASNQARRVGWSRPSRSRPTGRSRDTTPRRPPPRSTAPSTASRRRGSHTHR